MKKQFISLMSALALLVAISACGEDCKTCSSSIVVNTYLNDSLIGTATQTGTDGEFCGDQLEMVESGPVTSETEQNLGGMTQRVESITTYECN